jgi:hypothetical protein
MALSDLSAGGDGAGPGLRELRKRRIPKAILCTRFTSALRAGLPDRACDERHTGRVLNNGPSLVGFNGGGRLRPFVTGDERTRQLALRGVQAREAKRAARRADSEAVNVAVATVRAAHDRGELGPTARAAAIDLIGRVVMGEVPIRHATDAANLIRVLVDVARLEENQPMRTAVVANLSSDDVAERIRQMQQYARASMSPEDLAAMDERHLREVQMRAQESARALQKSPKCVPRDRHVLPSESNRS